MGNGNVKAGKKGEFIGVVTNNDDFVNKDTLHSSYAIKDENGKDTSPTNQIKDDTFKGNYNQLNLKRPLYNPDQLAGLLEINTYHKRCVKTKSEDIAGTGFKFNSLVDNPSEEEKERLDALFDNQFPPVGTQFVQAEIDYQAIGYCFLELVKEGNMHDTYYKYINHIPAHTMRVHRKMMKYCQIRGSERVWFKHPDLDKDVDKNTGKKHPAGSLSPDKRANDVIMMFNYTPRSDYYGVPEIIDALGAIYGNISQREYNNSFFKNHGIPNYAVYITGDYDLEKNEDGEYKIVKYIQNFLNQVRKNPHSSMVFGIPSSGVGGENVEVEFKELAVDEKDASFRMYRKDNRDEIVISHGVPPYRIGLAETGSLGGNTAKESNEIYKESIVSNRQEEIQAYINRYVIRNNLEVEDYEFILNPLEVESEENDRKNLEFLFQNGAASPNDLINNLGEQYGIEEIDDPAMDAHYINGRPITNLDELQQGGGEGQFMMSLNNRFDDMNSVEELFRAMKDKLKPKRRQQRDSND